MARCAGDDDSHRRAHCARRPPRVPAGTAAGGQFAGDGSAATTEGTGRAASAPILAGSPPDPQSVIDEFSEAFARNHTPMGGVIDVAKHQAAADAEAATFNATR